jgi:hypothetical protein
MFLKPSEQQFEQSLHKEKDSEAKFQIDVDKKYTRSFRPYEWV